MTTVRTWTGGVANALLLSGQEYRNYKVAGMEIFFPEEWMPLFSKEVLLIQEMALATTQVRVISVGTMLVLEGPSLQAGSGEGQRSLLGYCYIVWHF